MARRRWVQINGELVEVDSNYRPVDLNAAKHAGILWNDRDYQDMNDPRFNSRSSHKEFMKANGVTTIDDYAQTWKNAEKRRIDVRNGFDPSRRGDIAKSIEMLKSGYKPNIRKEL